MSTIDKDFLWLTQLSENDIDASRWARSVGVPVPCFMSSRVVSEAMPDSPGNAVRTEDIASIAMAILGRLKRSLATVGTFPVRFLFKSGTNGSERELEASLVTNHSGEHVLFVGVANEFGSNQLFSEESHAPTFV